MKSLYTIIISGQEREKFFDACNILGVTPEERPIYYAGIAYEYDIMLSKYEILYLQLSVKMNVALIVENIEA